MRALYLAGQGGLVSRGLRSPKGRPGAAQVHSTLQAVPRADRERSAAGRFSTLQAAPLHT